MGVTLNITPTAINRNHINIFSVVFKNGS